MQPGDARSRLIRLQTERLDALELGIERPSPYMTRLEHAIADARREYVTGAILEIAALRDTLAGATHDV
jgi:hypothetical protein